MELNFQVTQHQYLQYFYLLTFLFFLQDDHVPVEGETTTIIPEPIVIEDSSSEPPQKKIPRNTGVGARKIAPSPKVDPSTKTKRERKAPAGKGDKATITTRKPVSTESANSSPDADALKVYDNFPLDYQKPRRKMACFHVSLCQLDCATVVISLSRPR